MNSGYSDLLLKTKLLTLGCAVAKDVTFPKDVQPKNILLYSHSNEVSENPLPDDILLGNKDSNYIARIRFNSNSPLQIIQKQEAYYILDKSTGEETAISFPSMAKSGANVIRNNKISSICSYLGCDLLGVIPSNYCFYFKDGKQCKFCEIWDTFKEQSEYRKSFKDIKTIEQAIIESITLDPHIKHLAITTGNIKTYDFTAEYFCEIGNALLSHPIFSQIKHVLATLMPPDNFSIIQKIKNSGFNKIYFALEVFDRSHFSIVCPGKEDYGYKKILDALQYAVEVFGKGNVYTNFVYGIQSLNSNLDSKSYNAEKENKKGLEACEAMLKMNVIPAFTLYHYGGYNNIGKIELDTKSVYEFFLEWGRRVYESKLVTMDEEVVIFSKRSLSNTLYNDSFSLAKTHNQDKERIAKQNSIAL